MTSKLQRRLYEEGRSELDVSFGEGCSALNYLQGHSDLVDGLLARLADDLCMPARLLLLATGGYGRRELCPNSDIDLLIVYQGDLSSQQENWIKQLLHGLWDCGLRVGQQVWSGAQLQNRDETPAEFLLSLLDGRVLVGDKALTEVIPQPGFGERNDEELLVDELRRLVEGRHRSFAGTLYHLEPDVKEAPGGLRDVQTLNWLKRLRPSLRLDDSERVSQAREFLNCIRIALHLEVGRNENRLGFALQEIIAAKLGCAGSSRHQQAESLMGDYFAHARRIYRLSTLALGETVTAAGQGSELVELTDRQVLEEVDRWLDQGGVAVTGKLEGWQPPLEPPDWPALREPWNRLLHPRNGLYAALSELYEVGFLEYILPEFSAIRARVVRDFYHRYTVDEHTLVAVLALEDLRRADCPDSRFLTLLEEVAQADLLVLALLLHDIGKGSGQNHCREGVRLARQVLQRFEYGDREQETVLFLVKHHLDMSDVMQKRDVEDSEELHRFATHVRDVGRLRLLTLLTYADITAVAPNTLTAWKRDLLWQLYVGAHRQLTIEYGAERISTADLRDRLSGSIARAENQEAFRSFLEGFPLRYLETTNGDEIYRHFQMAQRLETGGVQTRLVQRRAHWELWVVTGDQARFFARIAGLMAYFEMNIIRARAFSNGRRIVLDSFHFEDPRGLFGRQPWEQERLMELIAGIVDGSVSVRELLGRKEGTAAFPRVAGDFKPRVRYEEGTGLEDTIVEIVAPDAMGLLYRISRAVADLECDVKLALVSTAGGTACDVFYLRHGGARLSSDLQAQLRLKILAALEEKPE